MFLRPIKCIDGAYGDDLDLFQTYYNLDYCIYCVSQYYANDRFILGGYTDCSNGGSPEIVTDKIPNNDTHRRITFGI